MNSGRLYCLVISIGWYTKLLGLFFLSDCHIINFGQIACRGDLSFLLLLILLLFQFDYLYDRIVQFYKVNGFHFLFTTTSFLLLF